MTILNDHFNQFACWPFSSHFSIVITIPHVPFLHNAPWCLSSHCSMAFVITMLHDPCHHHDPEFFSSQCSMTVSSQCSRILFITIPNDQFNHYARWPFSSYFSSVITIPHGPFLHNAPWCLSSQCSMAFVITMLQNPRSEERRVGKECLRLCRSRWSPYH